MHIIVIVITNDAQYDSNNITEIKRITMGATAQHNLKAPKDILEL